MKEVEACSPNLMRPKQLSALLYLKMSDDDPALLNDDPTFPIWQWEEGRGTWGVFRTDISAKIENLYQPDSNRSSSSSRTVLPKVQIDRWTYEIDFVGMFQRNILSQRQRKIRREVYSQPQWLRQTKPHLFLRYVSF